MKTQTALQKREFSQTDVWKLEQVRATSSQHGVGATRLATILHEHGIDSEPVRWAGITDWSKCALIDFRKDPKNAPGLQGSSVVRLAQLPIYFADVFAYQPIPEADMQLRKQFAIDTGYLLLGPDECVAVVLQCAGTEGHLTAQAYENSDEGVPRTVHGVDSPYLDWHATRRDIASLNATQTAKALAEVLEDHCQRQTYDQPSAVQLHRLKTTVALLEQHSLSAPPERTATGAAIKRWFIESGSTSTVDPLTAWQNGWKRYPTRQDAWYYGVWVNAAQLETLCYCEGDVSHVTCDSREQFDAELKSMAAFHGASRRPCAVGYGPEGAFTVVGGFHLLDGTVMGCVLSEGESKWDQTWNGGAPLIGFLRTDWPALQALRPGETLLLPKDAFQMDLCSSAMVDVPYQASATKCLFGYQLDVDCAGKRHIGLLRVTTGDELVA